MPFLWIALSLITGIITAAAFGGGIGLWLAALAIVLVFGIGILIIGRRNTVLIKLGWVIPATKLPVYLLLIFISLGGVLYLNAQPKYQPDQLYYYNDSDKSISIDAVVVEPSDYRTRSTLAVLKMVNFFMDGQVHPTDERIMAMLPPNTRLDYGDRVRLYARPETPFENDEFSYRQYLSTRKIFTLVAYPRIKDLSPAEGFLPGVWLFRFKDHLIGITSKVFPAPENGLITGIILGPRNLIPEDLYDDFRNSGTSHIIAISGFNIAILAALISAICIRIFGHWRGAAAAIIAITFYTLLVGGGASVVRASIMGGMAIMAQLIGRRQAGVNTLALTAFVMLLINPLTLWDVGFKLSFFATLGLIWFANPFQLAFKSFAAKYIPRAYLNTLVNWTGEYFLFTIAAQITTLPVLLYHFHQAPLALMLANPLILPAQPPLMGASAAAMAAGLIWLPLGKLIGFLAVPFTTYTIRVVEWVSGLNLPVYRTNDIPTIFVILYFVLLAVIVYKPGWTDKLRSFFKPAIVFTGLMLVTVTLWHAGVDAPDNMLHVSFLNDSNLRTALIQTPTGRYMLVNGGEDKTALLSAIDRRLPILHRQLDYLILAPGSSADMLAMTGAMPQLDVDHILRVGDLPASKSATNLEYTISDLGKSVNIMKVGDQLDLGGGAVLIIEKADQAEKMMKIAWKNFSILLVFGQADTGTWPFAGVVYLGNENTAKFDRFTPQLQIVDAVFENNAIPTINTIQSGWISLTTDGEQMWVETER